MNIIIVSDYADVNGGAAKVALISARALAEQGGKVFFFCAVKPISPLLCHPNIIVDCLDMKDVWHDRNPILAALRAVWNRGAAARLRRLLAGMTPGETVIHIHQWTKALSPSVLAASLGHGHPVIVTLHDYFIACPNGAYYHFAKERPCGLRPLSVACMATPCDSRNYRHKVVRLLRQWLTRRVLARAPGPLNLLAVSAVSGAVTQRLFGKTTPYPIVSSPIDIARAPGIDVARNRDFLFVGRLTPEKGVLRLARMARSMDLPLILVGDGPLRDELAALGGSIRCVGWVAASEVADYLARARALVFPSSWYETAGLVVAESLARGVPVIVSRTTGAAESVTQGETGYVIDPDEPDDLRRAMAALCDDRTAQRLGAEAYRRYWHAPPTPERHAGALRLFYEALLQGQQAGSGARG